MLAMILLSPLALIPALHTICASTRRQLESTPDDCPVATWVWERLVSLPIYPGMTAEEQGHVIQVVRQLCGRFGS